MLRPSEFLICPYCPSTRFMTVVNLKTHPNGGTSPQQVGYRCADCQADVDMAKMMAKAEKERKLREIRQLQEEVGEPTEYKQEKKELVKTSK